MASTLCNADCLDISLTPLPTEDCEPKLRKRQIDKIGLFLCNTELPDPFECAGIEPLVQSNDIVFTESLANVSFDDPDTEEVTLSDCLEPIQYITGRQMTADARLAIEDTDNDNLFADWDFAKSLQKSKLNLRFMLIFCDGSVEVPKDENGNPMSASFLIYRSFDEEGDLHFEIKKMQINFKGDPLTFEHPDMDDIGDCDFSTT